MPRDADGDRRRWCPARDGRSAGAGQGCDPDQGLRRGCSDARPRSPDRETPARSTCSAHCISPGSAPRPDRRRRGSSSCQLRTAGEARAAYALAALLATSEPPDIGRCTALARARRRARRPGRPGADAARRTAAGVPPAGRSARRGLARRARFRRAAARDDVRHARSTARPGTRECHGRIRTHRPAPRGRRRCHGLDGVAPAAHAAQGRRAGPVRRHAVDAGVRRRAPRGVHATAAAEGERQYGRSSRQHRARSMRCGAGGRNSQRTCSRPERRQSALPSPAATLRAVGSAARAPDDAYAGWPDVVVAASRRRAVRCCSELLRRGADPNAATPRRRDSRVRRGRLGRATVRHGPAAGRRRCFPAGRARRRHHWAVAVRFGQETYCTRCSKWRGARRALGAGVAAAARRGKGVAMRGWSGTCWRPAPTPASGDPTGHRRLMRGRGPESGGDRRTCCSRPGAPRPPTPPADRRCGWLPAMAGSPIVASLLQGRRRSRRSGPRGVTPLACAPRAATRTSSIACARAGANLAARTGNGDTPLMLAAAGGHAVVVRRLLASAAANDAAESPRRHRADPREPVRGPRIGTGAARRRRKPQASQPRRRRARATRRRRAASATLVALLD